MNDQGPRLCEEGKKRVYRFRIEFIVQRSFDKDCDTKYSDWIKTHHGRHLIVVDYDINTQMGKVIKCSRDSCLLYRVN